jgi:hypothetical protein
MSKTLAVTLALLAALAVQAGTTLPFNGKVAAVDVKNGTLTLSGPAKRELHVVDTSKVTRDGRIATLQGVVIGEPVSGSYNRADTNRLVAIRVTFGGAR